ncbi:hypothetical protein D9M71_299850 [compost metagenome]
MAERLNEARELVSIEVFRGERGFSVLALLLRNCCSFMEHHRFLPWKILLLKAAIPGCAPEQPNGLPCEIHRVHNALTVLHGDFLNGR